MIDTHAHYDDIKYSQDRDQVIRLANEEGVTHIINASSNFASISETLSLAQKYDFVYAAVGIHPHYSLDMTNNILSVISKEAARDKVTAIGEIGLDYYYDNSPKEIQKHWLSVQIDLAKQLSLPIIVHNRDAYEDLYRILVNHNAKQVGGVMHSYTGSVEMAKEFMKLGFYISFSGMVTFKNARRVHESVKVVPDELLLIETDCPYLTPEPHRGQRNDSNNLRYIVDRIAQLRDCSFEHIENVTTKNAMSLFGL